MGLDLGSFVIPPAHQATVRIYSDCDAMTTVQLAASSAISSWELLIEVIDKQYWACEQRIHFISVRDLKGGAKTSGHAR